VAEAIKILFDFFKPKEMEMAQNKSSSKNTLVLYLIIDKKKLKAIQNITVSLNKMAKLLKLNLQGLIKVLNNSLKTVQGFFKPAEIITPKSD